MLFKGIVTQEFLRNKRCKTILIRRIEKDFDIKIRTVKDFPVAMEVIDYNGKTEEYRYDGKNLYTDDAHIYFPRSPYENPEFSEDAVILSDDTDDVKKRLKDEAKEYVLYEGKLWQKTEEPTYEVSLLGDDPCIDVGANGKYSALEYSDCLKDAGKNPCVLRTIKVSIPEAVKRHPREEEIKEKRKRIKEIKRRIRELGDDTSFWRIYEIEKCLNTYL